MRDEVEEIIILILTPLSFGIWIRKIRLMTIFILFYKWDGCGLYSYWGRETFGISSYNNNMKYDGKSNIHVVWLEKCKSI
jgi:hypothetical protein